MCHCTHTCRLARPMRPAARWATGGHSAPMRMVWDSLWGWCRRGWRRRRGMRSIGTTRRGSRRRTIGESASGTAPLWHARTIGWAEAGGCQQHRLTRILQKARRSATVHRRLMSVAVRVAKAAAASLSPCPHPPSASLSPSLCLPPSRSFPSAPRSQADGVWLSRHGSTASILAASQRRATTRSLSVSLTAPQCSVQPQRAEPL